MIGIIDYGAGNTRSVQNALDRLGVEYVLTDDIVELNNCSKIIFPGVGSARSAMEVLRSKNLDKWIRECEKPFLGICLGMQLLFDFSEEGETECLGIMEEQVKRFAPGKKVPHMGWNISREKCKGGLSEKRFKREKQEGFDYFYFVHSYFVSINQYTVGECEYSGERFSAVVQKDNFVGMQFHPEKSGKVGEDLLRRFLEL